MAKDLTEYVWRDMNTACRGAKEFFLAVPRPWSRKKSGLMTGWIPAARNGVGMKIWQGLGKWRGRGFQVSASPVPVASPA
jgi:hypothetical protein